MENDNNLKFLVLGYKHAVRFLIKCTAYFSVIICLANCGGGPSSDELDSSSNSASSSSSGAAYASQIYADQCLHCHGDEHGNGVELGGALTRLQCDTCGTVNDLALKIEQDMPAGSPELCDANCSLALASYIFENFDGFGDRLTGADLYQGMCFNCHGDPNTPASQGTPLTPGSCPSCTSTESLQQRISSTMPFNDPDACVGDCARSVAEFIFSNFGFASTNEEAAENLGLPSGFDGQATVDGHTQLLWNNFDVSPDLWVLNRWDYALADWTNIALLNGNETAFLDLDKTNNRYQLFSITNNIASLPTTHRPTQLTLSTSSGDMWNVEDSGLYAYHNAEADFIAEVNIESLSPTRQWAKAGLMLRQDASANAPHVFVFITPAGILNVTQREIAGESTVSVMGGNTKILPPVRVQISKSNHQISIRYKKPDSSNWQSVVEIESSFATSPLIGLAVASNNRNEVADAVFSGFTLRGNELSELTRVSWDAQSQFAVQTFANEGVTPVAINPSVAVRPLKHLNRFELKNTLNDMHEHMSEVVLNADDTRSGFEVGLNTTNLGVEKYQRLAEDFSTTASYANSPICDPSTNNHCMRSFIQSYAESYLRRPASTALIERLNTLYDEVSQHLNSQQALQAVVESLAQTPSFLYKFEHAGVGAPEGAIVPITGFDMASRLAMMLWAGGPDKALLEAAEQGKLVTPAQIRVQAERMIEDPKALRGFRNFYRQWLDLEELLEVERTVEGVEFDEEIAHAMLDGIDSFIDTIVFSTEFDGRLDTLLTAPYVGNSDLLAEFTGIASNSQLSQVVATGLTADGNRTGLLGQPAILTLLAHQNEGSIVERGVYINNKLLCLGFPPPPDNVPLLDSIDPTNKSSRQILNELTQPASCWACHRNINPFGGVLENFDRVGRYRTRDDNHVEVDVSAELISRQTGLVDANVNGLSELNHYLASLDSVESCFVTQYLTYASGHIPSIEERSSVNWLVDRMRTENLTIKQLLVEATQTPIFLYKKLPN